MKDLGIWVYRTTTNVPAGIDVQIVITAPKPVPRRREGDLLGKQLVGLFSNHECKPAIVCAACYSREFAGQWVGAITPFGLSVMVRRRGIVVVPETR